MMGPKSGAFPVALDLAKTKNLFRVPAGGRFRLADHDPAWAGDDDIPEKDRRLYADEVLADGVAELARMQELLWASDTWSVLVIFQAMDAAGKDGAIKHVMSGINPQGVEVTSFKHPSAEELDHTFLWRCMKQVPERGRIGIFNRSYYEEVLIVRVHERLLEAQRIPDVKPGPRTWADRFDDINAFERHLARNGTAIVKFFLNVSRKEQRKRFLARIEEPDKLWKFSPNGSTGTATCGPTKRRSPPRAPTMRRGTWCRPTASGSVGPWWRPCSPTRSAAWGSRGPRSTRRSGGRSRRHASSSSPSDGPWPTSCRRPTPSPSSGPFAARFPR
jgi:PPK2 family polyphosphate:nucleotide phosphotransferase